MKHKIAELKGTLLENPPPWANRSLNPRGQPWRLSDPEMQPYLERWKKEVLSTPETARAYLIANGLLTKSGKLPRKYGGR